MLGLLCPDENEPSWIREHTSDRRRNALFEQKAKVEARLKQIRALELKKKEVFKHGESSAKRAVSIYKCRRC